MIPMPQRQLSNASQSMSSIYIMLQGRQNVSKETLLHQAAMCYQFSHEKCALKNYKD